MKLVHTSLNEMYQQGYRINLQIVTELAAHLFCL
jgi:hypothetical protein